MIGQGDNLSPMGVWALASRNVLQPDGAFEWCQAPCQTIGWSIWGLAGL